MCPYHTVSDSLCFFWSTSLAGCAIGGYVQFVNNGLNDAYLPIWLQQAGYNTYYTGKLMNGHSITTYNSPFAAGWNGSDCMR